LAVLFGVRTLFGCDFPSDFLFTAHLWRILSAAASRWAAENTLAWLETGTQIDSLIVTLHGSDFRYARTASASSRVIRKGGIGGLGGLPVREIPVVRRVIISASVPGGAPAIRGSTIAQLGEGYVGRVCVGPPWSQCARSGFPVSSRCVWQRSHIATPSTRYLPRSMRRLL